MHLDPSILLPAKAPQTSMIFATHCSLLTAWVLIFMLLPAFALAQYSEAQLLDTAAGEPTGTELWEADLLTYQLNGHPKTFDLYQDRDIIKSVKTANLPNFTDVRELFDTAGSMQISVAYIAIYRGDMDVCSLSTRTGNPDLAGAGAMASYYLQFVFVSLNNLVLLSFVILRRFNQAVWFRVYYSQVFPLVIKFLQVNHETYLWFTLALLLACFLHTFRTYSNYEISFIHELVLLEVWLLGACQVVHYLWDNQIVVKKSALFSLSRPQTWPMKLCIRPHGRRQPFNILRLQVLNRNPVRLRVLPLLIWVLAIALSTKLVWSLYSSYGEALSELEIFCHSRFNLTTNKNRASWVYFEIVLPVCFIGQKTVVVGYQALRRIYSMKKSSGIEELTGHCISISFIVAPCFLLAAYIEAGRPFKGLIITKDSLFYVESLEENKWGLGQFMAILAWFPLIWVVFEGIIIVVSIYWLPRRFTEPILAYIGYKGATPAKPMSSRDNDGASSQSKS